MSELTRYNAVPKIIGADMNVEFEAADDGQWVQADGAVTRVRELEEALGKLAAGFHDEISALKHQNQILQECQANHSWWIKRAGELEEALKDVLSRLPDMGIIEALKADAGLGYRLMPMKPTPSDADVVKWMEALKGREQ